VSGHLVLCTTRIARLREIADQQNGCSAGASPPALELTDPAAPPPARQAALFARHPDPRWVGALGT
jgi:hypothetical protein